MNFNPVNLTDKFASFTEHWSPRVVAELNDYQFKLVKIKGEFVWHSHPDTDEAFLVVSGEMEIQFRNSTVKLREGELYVVKKGLEHRPYAENECRIVIVEPRGVINTGKTESHLKAENDLWI